MYHYVSLDTHGIVSATVTTGESGGLNFLCHFKANSSSTGCLAISQGIATDNNSFPVFTYKIAHKVIDRASSSLQGLPVGDNKITFYEIEECGLPGRYPAVTRNVIVSTLSQHQGITIFYMTFCVHVYNVVHVILCHCMYMSAHTKNY